MINTGKLLFTTTFHRYITCSIPVSGWRARSKKTHEKWSEVQVDMPRSSSSLCGGFLENLFRDKGRTHDLVVFKITWKRLGIRENHQHKKVRIFCRFSRVYYLPHSDKVCRNYVQKTFLAIFKIDLKP